MKRLIGIVFLTLLLCGVAQADTGIAWVSVEDCTENGLENVNLAMEAINGVALEYGETFSFNELVGPRTESAGYLSAENGRGAMVTGGGVARVASAVYMALCEGDIDVEFKDRYTYGSRFAQDYVDNASDAILIDYASDIDFSFVCMENSITIELYIIDEEIECIVTVGEDEPEFFESAEIPQLSFKGLYDYTDSDLIASASIDLSDTDDQLKNNIEIAADSIDNTVLASNDVFSFNAVVGPRTEKYGYVSAVNGRGVKVTGGGVAQVASVLWLAVKNVDDIGIVKRSTYGTNYNQNYVNDANDAILTDYNGNIDFAFRNESDDEITIRVYISDDILTCEITD